jgi:hypothetical protein
MRPPSPARLPLPRPLSQHDVVVELFLLLRYWVCPVRGSRYAARVLKRLRQTRLQPDLVWLERQENVAIQMPVVFKHATEDPL